jgi:hypothetical protein
MIKKENIIINNKKFIKTYSDKYKIKKIGTNDIYDEAVDIMELKKYIANSGYVWKQKETGNILTETLYLGIKDKIENYEQVPKEELN